MKKLLLLLLVIPNLVMAETWVCSNVNEDGEIVTSTYKRKGDKFIIGNIIEYKRFYIYYSNL